MTQQELRVLLDDVPDTGDLVVRRLDRDDPLAAAWRQAEDEAAEAYRAWAAGGGRGAYAAYRAAQDRADAAFEALRPAARAAVTHPAGADRPPALPV